MANPNNPTRLLSVGMCACLSALLATTVHAGAAKSRTTPTSTMSVGSRIAGANSAMIMSSSTGFAADAAFNGSAAWSGGANAFPMNYAPAETNEPLGAFSALGFADDGKAAEFSADLSWNVWADVRGSWLTNSAEGSQYNGMFGLGYKISPDFVLGAFTGYEVFDFDFETTTSTTLHSEGDGWTVGAYAAWRLSRTLRLDGMVGWSTLSYDVDSTAVRASYDATRWTAGGGLTDTYELGSFTLNPSASLYVSWENQDAYTDDANNLHDELDFYTGRASIGGKIGKGFMLTETVAANPYLAAYGDWRFSSDDAVVANIVDTGIEDGWSARLGAGLSLTGLNGISASIGAEVGGVGQETQVWSATGRVGIPF